MIHADRWSILALLRFCLASVVAFNHLGGYVPLGVLAAIPALGAFEAILGFLLISGYSVTASYLQRPEGFLFRRLQRLYPIYLASIAITFVVVVHVQAPAASPGFWAVAANALLLNQLLTTTSFVGPAWSLSLEFWLYCLLPFAIALKPGTVRLWIYVSFGCYLVYTLLRTLLHLPYYSGVGYGGNLLFLSFIWLCGMRLARAEGESQSRVFQDIRLLFTAHIVAQAAVQFAYRIKRHDLASFVNTDSIGFGAQALMLFVVYRIFKSLLADGRAAGRKSKLMQTLGDISYPLYLIHIPVYIVVAKVGLTSPLAYYLISLAASYGVYLLVDFYSQRRDRPASFKPASANAVSTNTRTTDSHRT